jgi:hypothetical protein
MCSWGDCTVAEVAMKFGEEPYRRHNARRRRNK